MARQQFPDEFTVPEETPGRETRLAEQLEAGPGVPEDDRRQRMATINAQLCRLSRLREQVVAIEELNLDSKLRAAALRGLPGGGQADSV